MTEVLTHGPSQMKCPAGLDDVDLFGPGAQEHWFEAYGILHEQAPVHRIPGEGLLPGADAFILTRYDDIARVVRDPGTFPFYNPGDETIALDVYEESGEAAFTNTNRALRPDIETHKQHRLQLTDPWVGAVGAEQHRPMITRFANELMDRWIDDGEVEFVTQFAAPLPQMVIETILGFPLEDMPILRKWEEAQVQRFVFGTTHKNLLTEEQERENAETLIEFQRYIKDQIAKKRAEPQKDMVTFLTQVEFMGKKLSDDEIVGVAFGMHIGGNETTQYALTKEAQVLAEHPDIWAALKADRSKVRFFVEECLRLQAPTQGLSTRTVAADGIELSGVAVPRGSLLHLRYGAGNRDPQEFECPTEFRLDRPASGRHLTFSQGPRICPGAGLSRLEQNIAVNLWLDRIESIALAPGKNDFTHQPGIMLGLHHLNLQFEKA